MYILYAGIIFIIIFITYELSQNAYGYASNIEVNNLADSIYLQGEKDNPDIEQKIDTITYPDFTSDQIMDLTFSADTSYQ
jgi:hypothetical protein